MASKYVVKLTYYAEVEAENDDAALEEACEVYDLDVGQSANPSTFMDVSIMQRTDNTGETISY
jgi:hypothetical protein